MIKLYRNLYLEVKNRSLDLDAPGMCRLQTGCAVIVGGDKQGLPALAAEDIEWIIPGEDWPLAGTHRAHAGLADLLQKTSETMETSFMERREFVAQGDRVWSSASLGGESKPRIGRGRTIGSSPLPFEMAK
jgi:ketosteroid isomerase-like protein